VGGEINGFPLTLAKLGFRAEHTLQERPRFLPVHEVGKMGTEKAIVK
jgi:hypothetical protein